MTYEAVLTEPVHRQACEHLLRHVHKGYRQEEVCFALWRPGTGDSRRSAIVFELVLPTPGDRNLHGNASFEPRYLTRAVKLACARGVGLAFMHNHLSCGWQDMSRPDVVAERDRIAPPARASGLPLVGLTLAVDGAWSARFWTWDGTSFRRSWCSKVRVVGRRLRVTCNDALMPPPRRRAALRRTVDTWGEARQQDVARLRVGVVGIGSVGCGEACSVSAGTALGDRYRYPFLIDAEPAGRQSGAAASSMAVAARALRAWWGMLRRLARVR